MPDSRFAPPPGRSRVVLLAHDRADRRAFYQQMLLSAGEEWTVVTASCGEEAVEKGQVEEVCVAVIDLFLPNTRRDADAGRTDPEGGVWALERLAEKRPLLPVLLLAQSEPDQALLERARPHGLFDTVVRDEDHFEYKLLSRIRRAEELFWGRWRSLSELPPVIYRSEAFGRVMEGVRRAAQGDWPILIVGPAGSGKNLLAREIHRLGPRRTGPFVVVQCFGRPEERLDIELFGHAADAAHPRRGAFELAEHGTLLLDEVRSLTTAVQGRLLKAIEEKSVRPVGSDTPRKVDVRVVCATSADLMQAIREKTFREDLYYRICFERVDLPALRDRPEDIDALVGHLIQQHAARTGRPLTVHPSFPARLKTFLLPGNVRELEALLAAAITRLDPGDAELTENHLEADIFRRDRGEGARNGWWPSAAVVQTAVKSGRVHLDDLLEDLKYVVIDAALAETDGIAEKAADLLHVNPHTLRRYIRVRKTRGQGRRE